MTTVHLPHGSVVELDEDGSPRRWRAPDGTVVAELDGAGVRIELAGLYERPVTVGGLEEHFVLGPVQAIRFGDDGEPLARVAATDWRRPRRIPAIDAPARIPAGAGAVLLNVLALGAQAAGTTLRYAGPYPTSALWASLGECFRARDGDERRFTEGALDRALTGDTSEVPIDFVPAPFERVQVGPRAAVHLRDGVERLYLGGMPWSRTGPRRLTPDGDTIRVELWIGGAPWAQVATLDRGGQLVGGPWPLPPVRSSALGKTFPAPLTSALAELLCDGEPPLLVGAMREILRDVPIVWGDPGADAARPLGGAIVVHAAMWDRLGAGSLSTLATHLAAALATPVKQLAQRRLETIPAGQSVH